VTTVKGVREKPRQFVRELKEAQARIGELEEKLKTFERGALHTPRLPSNT
jgi:hypothetical protein